MDGRFVGYDRGGEHLRGGDSDDDDGTIDESELAHTFGLLEDGGEDGDPDDAGVDGEMVLSKDDFDLLQAFHRLVPLPALRSKIVHVVCDDDLQVVDEERVGVGGAEVAEPPPVPARRRVDEIERSLSSTVPTQVASAISLAATAKHSPLTRRLSTKTSTKLSAGSLLTKPHREINLAAQTPRVKKLISPGLGLNSLDGEDRSG